MSVQRYPPEENKKYGHQTMKWHWPITSMQNIQNATIVQIFSFIGLAGSSKLEEAHIRSLYDVLEDSMQAYFKAKFCDDAEMKEKLLKEYAEVTLPNHLNVFAKRLEGGKEWLVGDKVSVQSKTDSVASKSSVFSVLERNGP